MSFAGIVQFRKSLDALTECKAFRKAGPGAQLRMGRCLIASPAGAMDNGAARQLRPETTAKTKK